MVPRRRLNPRKSPKQARSQDTVSCILEATARVLVKHGYDEASTNKIAKTAGVSIGSLYQYFPNKQSLVLALIQQHVSEMLGILREHIAEYSGGSLEQGVRALIRASVEAHRMDPELHRVIQEQVPRLGTQKEIDEITAMSFQLIRAELETRAKQIRPKNLDLAAFILMTAVESITHGAVLGGHKFIEDDALIDETSELVLRYLRR